MAYGRHCNEHPTLIEGFGINLGKFNGRICKYGQDRREKEDTGGEERNSGHNEMSVQ